MSEVHPTAPPKQGVFIGNCFFFTYSLKKSPGYRTATAVLEKLVLDIPAFLKDKVEKVLLSVESYNEQHLKTFFHVHCLVTMNCKVALPFRQLFKWFNCNGGKVQFADGGIQLIKYICKDGQWRTWDNSGLRGGYNYAQYVKCVLAGTEYVEEKKPIVEAFERSRADVALFQAGVTNTAANHFLQK